MLFLICDQYWIVQGYGSTQIDPTCTYLSKFQFFWKFEIIFCIFLKKNSKNCEVIWYLIWKCKIIWKFRFLHRVWNLWSLKCSKYKKFKFFGKIMCLIVRLHAYTSWILCIGLTYTIIKYYISFSWYTTNTLHRFDIRNHQILYKLFKVLLSRTYC